MNCFDIIIYTRIRLRIVSTLRHLRAILVTPTARDPGHDCLSVRLLDLFLESCFLCNFLCSYTSLIMLSFDAGFLYFEINVIFNIV